METFLLKLLPSLSAIVGFVLAGLGIWAVATKRRDKDKTELDIPRVGKIKTRTAAYVLFSFSLLFLIISAQMFYKNRELDIRSRRLEASDQIISRFITPELLQSPTFGNIFRALPEPSQDHLLLKIAIFLKGELNRVMDKKKSDFIPIKTDLLPGGPTIMFEIPSFTERDLTTVKGPATFIHEIDPNNGHALYFLGEAARLLRNREASRRYFDLYLNNSEKAGGRSGPGDGRACYERAHGYCLERTAYICHLMALDFYRESIERPATAKGSAKEALGYVNCVYELRGKEFRQGKRTGELKEFFEKQIAQTSS